MSQMGRLEVAGLSDLYKAASSGSSAGTKHALGAR